jgi:hypothetical protein
VVRKSGVTAIRFHYDYSTADYSAKCDPFGYYTSDDGYVALAYEDDLKEKSGDVILDVSPGDSFSFYIETTDGVCGASEVTITNFQAIPEPAVLSATIITALFALFVRQRFRATLPR